MLRGMTLRQFEEWRAYADLEPFDEQRADLRAASIVQTLYNLFGRKKGQRAVKLEDCVIRFGKGGAAKKASDPKAIARVLDTLMLMQKPRRKGQG